MKLFQLFQFSLFLCLLIALNCKTSKEILKCAINKASEKTCNIFIDAFKSSSDYGFSMLSLAKSSFRDAINSCLD